MTFQSKALMTRIAGLALFCDVESDVCSPEMLLDLQVEEKSKCDTY